MIFARKNRLKQSSFDFRRLPEDSRRASLDRFARFRLGREPQESREEIHERRGERLIVVNIDAERKYKPFLVEEAEEFCEIFLYPTQVTLSVSKKKRKKVRYTTCKRILNVTVNCPYSNTPHPRNL